MGNFWKIETLSYWQTACQLRKIFPQLKSASVEDLEQELRKSDLSIIKEYKVQKPFWIRMSLPFGLVVMVVLFIAMPIKFMITGVWGYKWQWLSNWFRALGF